MTDRNESRPRSAEGCRSAGMAYIFDPHVLPVEPQPGVAISHQPSAISHQPSAISHQPSRNTISTDQRIL
jgi:hypothetical protein